MRISETRVCSYRLVHFQETNFLGRLHGGDMLRWIADTGMLASTRFAGGQTVLASLDKVSFMRGVPLGSTLRFEAEVQYVGNSSMEVEVTASDKDGTVVSATASYVKVDRNMRPTKVMVSLQPSGDEVEKYERARMRRESRLARISDRRESRFDVRDPTVGIRFRMDNLVYVSSTMTYNGEVASAGTVLKLMDDVGGILTGKYAGSDGSIGHNTVVTASIDTTTFYSPIFLGDIIDLKAGIVYVGRTSADVLMKVIRIDPVNNSLENVTTAYFTYVRVDERGRPVPFPTYTPETVEEIQQWEKAKNRRERKA